jgi:hypothetical protein
VALILKFTCWVDIDFVDEGFHSMKTLGFPAIITRVLVLKGAKKGVAKAIR